LHNLISDPTLIVVTSDLIDLEMNTIFKLCVFPSIGSIYYLDLKCVTTTFFLISCVAVVFTFNSVIRLSFSPTSLPKILSC
jgi:hypothetical protein